MGHSLRPREGEPPRGMVRTMQSLPRLLVVPVLLLCAAPLVADEGPASEPAKAEATFPATWVGVWKGACDLIRGGKTAMQFPMELHVAPLEAGRYTWTIVYGEGAKKQVRRYELLPVEGRADHFRIDEKNGIVLDAFLENDRLRNRFGVMDNVIEATYAREGDALTVTLTTFGGKPLATTGGKAGVPPVTSFALKAVQRGVLRRSPK